MITKPTIKPLVYDYVIVEKPNNKWVTVEIKRP